MSESVVIVGAGQAGDSAAALLRQYGWQGAITLVGDEHHAPYQRPPLSKALLLDQCPPEKLALKPATFYTQQKIELLTGRKAQSIDTARREITLADGATLAYQRLILATGARLRPLEVPGSNLAGVRALRTLPDALGLRAAIAPGKRVVIVGGGYIGLEAAASASKLGASVAVVEREARLLARVASPFLSQFMLDYHLAHNVAIDLDASVVGFSGNDGHVTAVELSDGRSLPCDVALVGIGVLAEQSLALAAGLECSDGVLVDAQARTSDPFIHAIGDCTRRPLALYGRMGRLESVQNASEQAKQAASDLCGRPAPAPEAPSTWSDQFDLRLQLVGLTGMPAETIVRGDLVKHSFAVYHLGEDDRLAAVEAVNAPMDFAFARMVAAKGTRLSRERLRDPAVTLKELAVGVPA
ncbi:MAG: NAD(P)/FAD-dependent oxidoreductase [Janthinobacterium lividum]